MKTFLRIIAACCVMALTGLTVFAQTDRVVISGTVKSESGVRGKTLCITHRFSVV